MRSISTNHFEPLIFKRQIIEQGDRRDHTAVHASIVLYFRGRRALYHLWTPNPNSDPEPNPNPNPKPKPNPNPCTLHPEACTLRLKFSALGLNTERWTQLYRAASPLDPQPSTSSPQPLGLSKSSKSRARWVSNHSHSVLTPSSGRWTR